MALFNRLISGFRALIGKTRSERELDAELRQYVEAAMSGRYRRA